MRSILKALNKDTDTNANSSHFVASFGSFEGFTLII